MTNKNVTNNTTYTVKGMDELRAELSAKVEEIVESVYSLNELTGVKVHLESELKTTKMAKLRLIGKVPLLSGLNAAVSKAAFKQTVASFGEEEKKNAWLYYNLNQRGVAINAILSSNQKLHNVVKDTLVKLFMICIANRKDFIQMDEALSALKLKIKELKIGDKSYTVTQRVMNKLKLQLVHELAVLDILDITKSKSKAVRNKSYVVSLPLAKMDKISQEELDYLVNLSSMIKYNTILVEPARVGKKMMSQSSWFYQTPELSADQVDFINIMHTTKWNFVPDAEELIGEAYRLHLAPKGEENTFVLPEWADKRIEEFRKQINVSKANEGHYIRGLFDSSLRWYWQSEVGHNQLSESLRDLVVPADMKDVVKYDMTNSVVQMYALGLKDKTLASYVGLTSQEDSKRDLRTVIADSMNASLNINTFNRDNIKPLFMVWAYNGGRMILNQDEFTEEVTNFFTGEVTRKIKREGLYTIAKRGNNNITLDEVWDTFNGILEELVPSIVELKQFYSEVITENPFTETKWTLPDGAVSQYAAVKTVEEPIHWVDADGKEHQHTTRYKTLAEGAGNAGLLPRVIHSIDAYAMRQIVLRCKAAGFTVVPNHDSFMFSKRHTAAFMSILKSMYIEIMEQGVLADIFRQINYNKTKINIKVSERIPLTKEDILQGCPVKLELG